MDPAVPILVIVLLLISVVVRFYFAGRGVKRVQQQRTRKAQSTARQRPSAASQPSMSAQKPGFIPREEMPVRTYVPREQRPPPAPAQIPPPWYFDFMEDAFQNPAFREVTMRCDTAGDMGWYLTATFKGSGDTVKRDLAKPVRDKEIDWVEEQVKSLGWRHVDTKGDKEGYSRILRR
jgi:hypothetical protein